MSDVQKIRNFALLGHNGSGKTSLAEAMLFKAKATSRLGSVDDGTSVLDFDEDEKERKSTVDASVATFKWDATEFTLIDTPGPVDFQGEAFGAVRAADFALFCVPASGGLGVNTRVMWSAAREEKIGRAIVITKTDAENADAEGTLEAVREALGERCIPFSLNEGHRDKFTAVLDCLEPGDDAPAEVKKWHEALVEASVEADEAALEQYLEEGDIDRSQLTGLVTKAIAAGTVVPVFFTSVPNDLGVEKLMRAMAHYFPSPADRRPMLSGESPETAETPITADPNGPLVAQVFKVVTDDYVGKLAFFRVFSGSVAANTNFHLVRSDSSEKMVNILTAVGKETTQVDKVSAGQIAAMARVENIRIGDTFTDGANIHVAKIPFPNPMVALAVEPKSRGDETKIGPALNKLAEEDATLTVKRVEQTHETVITGLSDLHLNLKLGRMNRRSKVEVNTRLPKVPYLETITASGDAKYRHKKQSGGAGQFAEVWMRINPVERGKGFEYNWKVVGGAISNNFQPSIEKGIRQVMDSGVIAGCKVVDVCCEVYDGKEHPVDSKDVAFQIAGREVFKEAMKMAKPVLLEPIMDVRIIVPTKNMGDITSDLNTRRGRIQGMDAEGGMQVIRAQIPLAEMQSYSTELRSLTGGEGTYSAEESHFDVVPANVANDIKSKYEAQLEAEKGA